MDTCRMSLTWLLMMITTLVIITTLFFFYNNNNNKNLKKKQLPEAEGGWPFIGHLRLLSAGAGPDLPHVTLSNMADKYGPVFSIRLGVHRALVVSSWEAAKECFTVNDVTFSNRPEVAAIEHMGYNFAMFGFSPYGPYWRELRKITMQNLLSVNKVAMFGDSFEIEIRAMMRKLFESSCGDEKVEMDRVLGDMTYDLMVRLVVGDIISHGDENEEIRDMGGNEKFHGVLREFFRLMVVLTIPDVFPILKRLLGRFTNKAFKSAGKKMDGFLQAWLDDYNKFNNISSHENNEICFMAKMMAVTKRLAQEYPQYGAADTIVKATCQIVMLGGTDTMAVILTWAVSLLLNNPQTLTRAQQELDLCVGRQRRVKSSDVQNLVYIKAVIKETFRLYAPPLASPRVAAEDCTVAGFHVPAGTRLMVNVWKLHRDPRVWADPLEFRPERFLAGHKAEVDVRGQHFELLPFGSGRRVCPGITFSLQLTELALASLLHGFGIEKPSSEPIDMTGSLSSSNRKSTPLQVRITPRLSPSLYA